MRDKIDKIEEGQRTREEEKKKTTLSVENRQKSTVRQSTGLRPLAEPKSKHFSLSAVFDGMLNCPNRKGLIFPIDSFKFICIDDSRSTIFII